MTEPYKKKLIEVAIPLEAINAASAREKSIRHGHPSTLHLWWARRPLAACRAVLFAQLVDDPSGYTDTLLEDPKIRDQAEQDLEVRLKAWQERKADAQGNVPNTPKPTLADCAADIERKRLFKIIEDLVKWENSTNEAVLEKARAEIRRSCDGVMPPVYDPFSGGGSIPLEAQRLGLPAYGADLNPVAVTVGKATIEIPLAFKDKLPIHPGPRTRTTYRNAEGLAEDVAYYGEWVRDRAWGRIRHLYPQIDLPIEQGEGKATVLAWIWTRTVPSPDPAYEGAHVPIASTFLLSSKAGAEVFIDPIIDRNSKTIKYRVTSGGAEEIIEESKTGTKRGRGASFLCLLSGTPITMGHIRRIARNGDLGRHLMAIVAAQGSRRFHLSPDARHVSIADSENPFWKPTLKLSDDRRAFTPPDYGMTDFSDLFTKRQLVALKTIGDAVQEVREEIIFKHQGGGGKNDARSLQEGGDGLRAYAEAVSIYLAFALDKCADYWSTIVTWMPRGTIGHMFTRPAIPMTWDYPEANPFADDFHCSFKQAVSWVVRYLDGFNGRTFGRVEQSDARVFSAPIGSVVSTDPPYYDNVPYADASDFFYVWLKRAIAPVYPELFSTISVPKSTELVADKTRLGSSQAAEEFFLKGMKGAMESLRIGSSERNPTTLYYASKQKEEVGGGTSSTSWATFLESVFQAGYTLNATWPIRTERSSRMRAIGSNALANSVVLVCRKKDAAADTLTRAEFIRALKRELPPAIAQLQAANIAPADMPQSAIGPGMGVFSRHKAVLEADDSPMTVKTALQLINRELDEFLGGIQGEFDADTRFALTWFEQHGMDKGEFGAANSLATARGISVDSVKHAGIVESAAGKVRILRRAELPTDWDPVTDPHLTVWECCQHLIRLLEQDGEQAAATLLKKFGGDRAEAVKDLAYCLYDIAANKRKDAKEATAYNGLIAVWTDLTRLAATIHDVGGDRQTRLDF